jgi:1-deoxy-D-xylulose-5-phosphate synthase
LVKSAEIIGERLDATVVNMRYVKPLDEELVLRLSGTHTALVTIEENAVGGGAGSAVIELLANCAHLLPTLTLGIPDRFIEHGSRDDCLAQAGLDLPGLEAAVRRWWEHLPASKMMASGT